MQYARSFSARPDNGLSQACAYTPPHACTLPPCRAPYGVFIRLPAHCASIYHTLYVSRCMPVTHGIAVMRTPCATPGTFAIAARFARTCCHLATTCAFINALRVEENAAMPLPAFRLHCSLVYALFFCIFPNVYTYQLLASRRAHRIIHLLPLRFSVGWMVDNHMIGRWIRAHLRWRLRTRGYLLLVLFLPLHLLHF